MWHHLKNWREVKSCFHTFMLQSYYKLIPRFNLLMALVCLRCMHRNCCVGSWDWPFLWCKISLKKCKEFYGSMWEKKNNNKNKNKNEAWEEKEEEGGGGGIEALRYIWCLAPNYPLKQDLHLYWKMQVLKMFMWTRTEQQNASHM